MFRTTIVPLDGSDLAKRVLPFARKLAHTAGGRLILVRAAMAETNLPGTANVAAETEKDAAAYLEKVAAECENLPVETMLVSGHAGDAILHAVRERGADTIAMTTHGRSGLGRWLYGSVADHILRHASVPILLIPPTCEVTWENRTAAETVTARRVLIPLDGSAFGETALPAALRLATLLDADLDLLRAIEMPTSGGFPHAETLSYVPQLLEEAEIEASRYLQEVVTRLRAEVRTITPRITVGWPGTALAKVARERHSCAIAMSTHGRSGVARVVLGSVATLMLQQSPAPLLLVRPPHILS